MGHTREDNPPKFEAKFSSVNCGQRRAHYCLLIESFPQLGYRLFFFGVFKQFCSYYFRCFFSSFFVVVKLRRTCQFSLAVHLEKCLLFDVVEAHKLCWHKISEKLIIKRQLVRARGSIHRAFLILYLYRLNKKSRVRESVLLIIINDKRLSDRIK